MIEISNSIHKVYDPKELSGKYWKYSYWHKYSNKFLPSYTFDKNIICLPRNLMKFFDVFPEYDMSHVVLQYTTASFDTPLVLNPLYRLREYQAELLSSIKTHHTQGIHDLIISMPASSGKSYMITAYLDLLRQKTLIIVDSTLLQNQIYTEITQNAQCDIQIVKNNTNTVCDVNVVTVQLLMRNENLLALLKHTIGSVILDEAHIVPAMKISKIIQTFPAQYRLALTATPSRSDGLDNVIFDIFGDTILYATNPNALMVAVARINSNCNHFFYNSLKTYKSDLAQFIQQHDIVK